jgi:hypothetical protein
LRLSPSPRSRGEGRGEGLFFEFGKERFEPQIPDDIVVPDAEHAIAEDAEVFVALLVFRAFRVLAATELDN